MVFGWFPANETPYKEAERLGPSVHITVNHHSVKKTNLHTLRTWFQESTSRYGRINTIDLLEEVRATLLNSTAEHCRKWAKVGATITGGYDSRAIASCLIKLGQQAEYSTVGKPDTADVIISKKLAEVAGLHWVHSVVQIHHNPSSELIINEMERFVQWTDSLSDARLVFYNKEIDRDLESPGYFVGHFGEIARGFYYGRLPRVSYPFVSRFPLLWSQWKFLKDFSILAPGTIDRSKDILKLNFEQADGNGMMGMHKFDFLYLNERGRRWSSGESLNGRNNVICPYTDRGYICLSFLLSPWRKSRNEISSFITSRNAPQWDSVPYEKYFRHNEQGKGAVKSNAPSTDFWRSDMREGMESILANSNSFLFEIVDIKKVRELWRQYIYQENLKLFRNRWAGGFDQLWWDVCKLSAFGASLGKIPV